VHGSVVAGTSIAIRDHMAAVLCLVFLPVLGAILFMLGSMGGPLSFGAVMAAVTFLMLGVGIVIGALNMSRGWEADAA